MDMYKVSGVRVFGRFTLIERPVPADLASNVTDPFMARIDFDNGYTASVVRHNFSYGGPEGLMELAVIRDGVLVYDTPVTSDVESSLSEADVLALLEKVEAL